MQKTALILGIQGQDGSLLAKHLTLNGYRVIGGARQLDEYNNWRLKQLEVLDLIHLEYYSIENIESLKSLLTKFLPNEIYLLAGDSKTYDSFLRPKETQDLANLSVINLLELSMKILPNSKIFLAGSSEMFGRTSGTQNTRAQLKVDETSYCEPLNPYGISKLTIFHLGRLYREFFKMHVVTGILFNHESPYRPKHFVTRKIVNNLVRIKKTDGDFFTLGNINMERDWSDARDIVLGIHQALQAPKATDYVFASGNTHSVREFLRVAALRCGFIPIFEGVGMDEVLKCKELNKVLMRINPKHFRAIDTPTLLGDSFKAEKILRWHPQISFECMVNEMVDVEINRWDSGNLFH
jgi:GDPmannose 4,6-dehydratase